jgi:uncharacterized Fe-S cluster protein YjdI/predicted GNAT family acetyltransferase
MHRLYENDDIVIFWNSSKCNHSRNCVTGCPEVFDFARRPWIDLSRADNVKVWQTVETCPSGALKVQYRHGIDVVLDPENHRSLALDGEKVIGECEFSETPDGWIIYHTGVRPEYEGKGIARRLVYKVVEAGEKSDVEIGATCSYAAKLLGE